MAQIQQIGSPPNARIIEAMTRELGAEALLHPGEAHRKYLVDWSGDHVGRALAILRPATLEQACRAMRFCARRGLRVIPQGGNTGLASGAISGDAGAVVFSAERLNRIRDINPVNLSATVEAGCILEAVKAAVAAQGCHFPVSLGAQGSCQIGGMIATNAGGTNVVKYGMTREHILGLEVVLPDGSLWSGLSGLRKDNRGPDLKQLFIGSEGVFGVVTAACIKLSPALKQVETAFAGCNRFDDAMALLQNLRAACFEFVSGFEVISNACLPLARQIHKTLRLPLSEANPVHVLIELSSSANLPLRSMLEDFLAGELERGRINDAVVAQNQAQARDFWKVREGLVEGHEKNGFHVRSDVSVQLEKIPTLIGRLESMLSERFPDWTAQTYGHAGDGNIHFNALPPPGMALQTCRETGRAIEFEIFNIVDRLNGSFSAEHGIGRSKRARFAATGNDASLKLLAGIKDTIDPNGLMNPGCLIQREAARA
ncbi:MAG: FAD-binding oxidoreductase [Gammaproteobacteria bacterium]|nr:FAD-binding oxidoreductase [Gammaproteobacteria bacterium]